MKSEARLILDNIRSVHNVGSIFRTADAAGVSLIYLCGVTPAPVDRFGRKRKDLSKVSLGAEVSVSWKSLKTVEEAIAEVRKEGFTIVAVEQSKEAVPYIEMEPFDRTCFILGNEREGINESLLRLADLTIEIPMHGEKESLNVAVTAGIVLFSNIENKKNSSRKQRL